MEEPEPKIKKERNPAGMVYGGTSAVFQLQTEPLNTLTEQQQRLFRTRCYFGAASVFSVWPGGQIRQTFLFFSIFFPPNEIRHFQHDAAVKMHY